MKRSMLLAAIIAISTIQPVCQAGLTDYFASAGASVGNFFTESKKSIGRFAKIISSQKAASSAYALGSLAAMYAAYAKGGNKALTAATAGASAFAGLMYHLYTKSVDKELINFVNQKHTSMQKLLAAHADPNAKNENGEPVLITAIKADNTAIANSLVSAGADPNVVYDGKTPLHEAVQVGSRQIINDLIAHKADIHSRDSLGRTPLMLALQLQKENIVSQLIDLELQKSKNGKLADVRDNDGLTPLMYATQYYPDYVMNLAEVSDIMAQDNNGMTAYHWAAWYRNQPGHEQSNGRNYEALQASADIEDNSGMTVGDIFENRNKGTFVWPSVIGGRAKVFLWGRNYGGMYKRFVVQAAQDRLFLALISGEMGGDDVDEIADKLNRDARTAIKTESFYGPKDLLSGIKAAYANPAVVAMLLRRAQPNSEFVGLFARAIGGPGLFYVHNDSNAVQTLTSDKDGDVSDEFVRSISTPSALVLTRNSEDESLGESLKEIFKNHVKKQKDEKPIIDGNKKAVAIAEEINKRSKTLATAKIVGLFN